MSGSRRVFLLAGLPLIIIYAAIAFWALKDTAPTSTETTPETPQALSKIILKKAYTKIAGPTAIAVTPDGSNRLYITEQSGKVQIAQDGKINKTAFIDIVDQVLARGEMGLLGIAFHPKITTDRRVFLNYVDKDMFTNISSFEVSKDLLSADPKSEKVLIRFQQPYENHNGGDLQFGPDGYLYIATGDGGSGGDPENRAQNLSNFLGKILRIDVNSGSPYKVPSDNPFVKTKNAKAEIWYYGLRNPWRFSFDKQTGDMWLSDVGQNKWEEINFVPAGSKSGLNFGWRCYEGTHQYNLEGCKAKSTYAQPLIEYDQSGEPCSVTGGYVYRGSKFPMLVGKYLYADLCSGEIFAGVRQNGVWKQESSLNTSITPSTFGQDNNGELYIADIQGETIYQISAE